MKNKDRRFWFEKFDCFSIYGKDANNFLNTITTGNITNSNNKVCKTCWLTPNGVLRALIEVNFLDSNLEVIVLAGDTNELREYFDKIIFPADDVSLGETFSINRFQEVDEINSWKNYEPFFLKNEDQEYEKYKNELNLINANDLKLWKINQAIPSLNNEIDGKNNPLELGLTDLIDFNKGCFLGQETISKIKNVSTLKQQIRVWNSLDSMFKSQAENINLYSNLNKEKIVGKITSFYKLDKEIKGLAMIKRNYLEMANSFYSEIFGEISIKKSAGSDFL